MGGLFGVYAGCVCPGKGRTAVCGLVAALVAAFVGGALAAPRLVAALAICKINFMTDKVI